MREKEVASAMQSFQKRICSAKFSLQAFTGFVVPFNLFMFFVAHVFQQ
jgi:hypothetical protein